ncbi:MAG: transglutaminase-like domain-containing protein [bacterium]|nr:transglutaminase-like domain-containing protein [bacterium]
MQTNPQKEPSAPTGGDDPVTGPGPAPEDCLASTYFLDHADPAIQAFVAEHTEAGADRQSNAVRLYFAVRDGLRYNPYKVSLEHNAYRISRVVALRQSYCIPKAMLFAGVCRAIGVPARLGFGDVKNHLSSERLIDFLGTDLFAYHGYAEVYLNDRWVQATPAFDRVLCRKFGVAPLDFNGEEDSLFQEFAGDGHKFMEYINYHGTSADLPFDWLMQGMTAAYPKVFAQRCQVIDLDGDLMNEA